MRRFVFVSALLTAFFSSPAVSNSILTVTPAALSPGDTVTWTVRGRPGQFVGIGFSLNSSGASFRGAPLALGTDARVLAGFSGTVDATGRFVVTLAVPRSAATGTYYFQAIIADDPAFTTNTLLSTGVAVNVSQPLGMVAGELRDDRDGSPVPGAVVVLDDGRLSVVADPDGRFSIRGVPLGPHRVRVTAFGFSALTLPALDVRDTFRDLTLVLLRSLPPAAPPRTTLVVDVPNAGGAEVIVTVGSFPFGVPQQGRGRSPVTVDLGRLVEFGLRVNAEVTVSAPGFLTVVLSDVEIPGGSTRQIRVVLPPS